MDTDDIARQIQRLTHHDPFIRQEAARTLGAHGDTRAVAPLIAALHDTQADVRRTAAAALGRVGDARAIPPLTAALRERENALRRAAGATLMSLGNPVAAARAYQGNFRDVMPLLKALREGKARRNRDPSPYWGHDLFLTPFQTSASQGAQEDAGAVLMVEALTDEDTVVPWLAAAEALGRIAERLPRPELRGALSCLRALADCALSDEQRDVCWAAARKIEDMRLPLRDLPLPAGAPPPQIESLPLPAVASAPDADSLPVASLNVLDGGLPTGAEAMPGWRQRLARALRWRDRHG